MIAWFQTRLFQTAEYLFLGGLFLLPFQILHRFYDLSAYASGLFSIYQSAALYLSDLCFVGAIVFGFLDLWKQKRPLELGSIPLAISFILLLLLAEISSFWAIDFWLAWFSCLRLLAYVLLYFWLLNTQISLHRVAMVIVGSLLFQIVLATFQYFTQLSLGFYFLGEPFIASYLPGLAKISKDGATFVRPYGTFLHPNILAGVLAVNFFLLRYLKLRWAWIIRIIFLCGLILTFSRSAWIAFLMGLIGYIFFLRPKVHAKQRGIELIILGSLGAILLPFLWFRWENLLIDPAINDRLELLKSALAMIWAHPWGVGLSHFTLMLPQFSATPLAPWEMQPVHNVFVLVAAETGILGGLCFTSAIGLFLYQLWQRRSETQAQVFGTMMFVAVVLMLGDHYFWDLVSGSGYLWLMLGLGGRQSGKL